METIVRSFLRAAEKYPAQKAFEDRNSSCTYREAADFTARLAELILQRGRELGVDVEKELAAGRSGLRVGVFLPRTKEIPLVALGILRAGCVYVPIDTSYPAERIGLMIEDAGCRLIVTDREQPAGLKLPDRARWLYLSDIAGQQPVGGLDLSALDREGLILFTSGSTGRAKGVLHTQRIFPAAVTAYRELFPPDADGLNMAVWLTFSSMASLFDAFAPLFWGGSLYVFDEQERLDVRLINEVAVRNRLSSFTMTAKAALTMLAAFPELPVPYMIVGAENLESVPDISCRLIYMYGSSEAGQVAWRLMQPGDSPRTVGQVKNGWQGWLVDEAGSEITEPGRVGELCIAGGALALGYLNRPAETAKAFTDNPFAAGERLYHTGDLMARLPNGELEFHGRRDNMVKLRGYTIELGEIEAVCRKTAGIKDVVCALKNCNGAESLCLYYATADGAEVGEAELRARAARFLPYYMVPEKYQQLAAIPLNANGKVDRLALPQTESAKNVEKRRAATDAAEAEICTAFAEALGLSPESVGADDDFVLLGGSSLTAMQLVAELDRPELGAMDILQARTPAKIAALLRRKAQQLRLSELVKLEQAALGRRHKPTALQEYMIAVQQEKPGSTIWNFWERKRFDNSIDAERLCDAVNRAIQNHPALSVVFHENEAGEHELSYEEGIVPKVVPERVTEAEAQRLVQAPPQVFALFESPLCRFRILRSEKYTYLFTDLHHLLLDGRSFGALTRSIEQAYYGRELPKDYFFAQLAQREARLATGDYEAAREYFRTTYGSTDWCCGLLPEGDAEAEKLVKLSLELALEPGTLEQAEKKSGFTRNCFALLAGLLALAECTGRREVLLLWIYDNRTDGYLQDSVGYFLQEFPVALKLDAYRELPAMLAEIERQIQGGIRNSIFCKEDEGIISFETEPVTINYLQGIGDEELLGEFRPQTLAEDSDHGVFDIFVREYGDRVQTELWYPAAQYSREKVAALLEAYNKYFAQLVSSC